MIYESIPDKGQRFVVIFRGRLKDKGLSYHLCHVEIMAETEKEAKAKVLQTHELEDPWQIIPLEN